MLPEEAYRWHYIEKAFADICERYGFTEIRTPMFEHTELFHRGVGDTTDIVQKEVLHFPATHAENGSITLKPEGTSGSRQGIRRTQACTREPQPTKYLLRH